MHARDTILHNQQRLIWNFSLIGLRFVEKRRKYHHQKCPQNGGFPPFVVPQDFLQNRALSKKFNGWSPRYFTTDGRMTDKQGWLHRTPLDKLGSKKQIYHATHIFPVSMIKRLERSLEPTLCAKFPLILSLSLEISIFWKELGWTDNLLSLQIVSANGGWTNVLNG